MSLSVLLLLFTVTITLFAAGAAAPPPSVKWLKPGHSSEITFLAYSGMSNTIASASLDGTVKLWDASTGGLLRTMDYPEASRGGALAIAENFRYLIRHSQLIDLSHDAVITNISGSSPYALSPDARYCATTVPSDQWPTLYNAFAIRRLPDLTLLGKSHTGKHDYPVAAFSPDGNMFAASSKDSPLSDGFIVLNWCYPFRSLQSLSCPDGFRALAFAPDSTLLASGYRSLRVWSTTSGALLFTNKLGGYITAVAFSPVPGILAAADAGSSEKVLFCSTTNGHVLRALNSVGYFVSALAFSPNGDTLLTGGENRCLLEEWNSTSGARTRTLSHFIRRVQSVSFSQNNHYVLAYGGRTSKLRSSSGEVVTDVIDDNAGPAAYAHGSDSYVIAGSSIRLYQDDILTPVRSFDLGGKRATAVAFSPQDDLVAAGVNEGLVSTIKVWDVSNGLLRRTIVAHSLDINGLCFSPDGLLLVSASSDGTGKVWRMRESSTVPLLVSDRCRCAAAFSPSGDLLALADADNTTVLRTSDWAVVATLTGGGGLAFDPNGVVLATGRGGTGLRFWSVIDGSLIASQESEANGVCAIAYSNDRRAIAVGRSDGVLAMLTNPFASDAPVLLNSRVGVEGHFEVDVRAAVGDRLRVEQTSNWREWTSVTNVLMTNVVMQIVGDKVGLEVGRFYRVVLY